MYAVPEFHAAAVQVPPLPPVDDGEALGELPPVGDPTVVSRVKDHISHMVITRVRSAGENRLVIEGSLKEDGATYEITLEKSGNQIRIWRGVRDPNGSTPTTMIDEGMVPGTAVSIAWEQRCEPTELGQRVR